MITCCVNGCANKAGDDPGRNFFPLPAEPNLLEHWLELIRRTDLSQSLWQYRVCSDHFSRDDIKLRPVLDEQAVPNLKLPTTDTTVIIKQEFQMDTEEVDGIPMEVTIKIEEEKPARALIENVTVPVKKNKKTQCVYVQTPVRLPPCRLTEAKRKNKTINENAKLKLEDRATPDKVKFTEPEAKFAQMCDQYLHKRLSSIVKYQSKLSPKENVSKSKNRYPEEFKTFALNLYFCSPVAYRYLKLYFNLPCKRTVNRMHIYVPTGINEEHFETFKLAVADMRAQDKICNVCVDYMPIHAGIEEDKAHEITYGRHEIDKVPRDNKPPARYAVVVAVTGLIIKWRQVLAYALTAECEDYVELNEWIDGVIALLVETGLDVRCLVTDTSGFFWKYSRTKDVSENKTHFEINGKKIFYVFNVPDLLRNTRDILMKYDLNFLGDKVAKWRHIRAVHEKCGAKVVPKFTATHVSPCGVAKTKTVLAAQTFSATVAQAIKSLVSQNSIERQAEETAELVTKFNALFDLLNSQSSKEECAFKKPYLGDDEQKAFIEESLLFLESLKVVQAPDVQPLTFRFTKAFMVTIRSVMALHADLKAEGKQTLSTRHLNLDSIEFFFNQIKKFGGKDKTKAATFAKAFVRLYFRDTLRLPGKQM